MPAVQLNAISVGTVLVVLIVLIYTEQRRLLSVLYFLSLCCCLLGESKSAWPLIGFCLCWESTGSRGAALGEAAGLPLSWKTPPGSTTTTNWRFGGFFLPFSTEIVRGVGQDEGLRVPSPGR